MDGRLDEAAWRQATWITDFTTREPVEGGRPAGATEVDADKLVAVERRSDPVPELAREAEPVDEHHRRSIPLHLHVELCPVHDNLLLNHHASRCGRH